MLAYDRNPWLEEIVSNFEIINKRILSVARRMFSLIDVDRLLKNWSLDVYQLQQRFWPAKCKNQAPYLGYISDLVLFWFLVDCRLLRLSDIFCWFGVLA